MTRKSLANLLYAAAVAQAIAAGFRLGEGADEYFREKASKAAGEILKIGELPDDSETKMEEAVRNFRSLVDAMISVRGAAYAGFPDRLNSNIIGEITISEALRRLCPIWPFCP